MLLRTALHQRCISAGCGPVIVGHDTQNSNPLALQCLRISCQSVCDGLNIQAVVAQKHDQYTLLTDITGDRVRFTTGRGERKVRRLPTKVTDRCVEQHVGSNKGT